MAISIQPVDGLINRLLQQNSKPSAPTKQDTPQASAKHDQVSISNTAQKHQSTSSEAYIQSKGQSSTQHQQKPGERALESHLLNLYKKNDIIGG